jgi:hypothetical protein
MPNYVKRWNSQLCKNTEILGKGKLEALDSYDETPKIFKKKKGPNIKTVNFWHIRDVKF